MAKTFYTERDIEDLARSGKLTLDVGEDVVLTELAYERAERLGVKLVQPHDLPPAAPVRPYLIQPTGFTPGCKTCGQERTLDDENLHKRIRDSVQAKLGNQVDPVLLETIITRVLNNIGIK